MQPVWMLGHFEPCFYKIANSMSRNRQITFLVKHSVLRVYKCQLNLITLTDNNKYDHTYCYLMLSINSVPDLTVICSDGMVTSHQIILGLLSDFLKPCLSSPSDDQSLPIFLPDFEVNTFRVSCQNVHFIIFLNRTVLILLC